MEVIPRRDIVAYSNSRAIRSIDRGPLQGWTRHVQAQAKAGVDRVKTAIKYQDKSGKSRYKGAGAALKATE